MGCDGVGTLSRIILGGDGTLSLIILGGDGTFSLIILGGGAFTKVALGVVKGLIGCGGGNVCFCGCSILRLA